MEYRASHYSASPVPDYCSWCPLTVVATCIRLSSRSTADLLQRDLMGWLLCSTRISVACDPKPTA